MGDKSLHLKETPVEWQIVIIDDEKDIRDVIAVTLTDAGYGVWDAASGQEGLELCRIHGPQIVITDIKMPGMDGLEVLKRLKQSTPGTEVIVATAFGDMEMAIRALQLDASDFITKPINDEALHLALKRARERFLNRKKLDDYTALLEKEVVDQARILHQDKMMSLGRLAASVVHEINNPLSGVLNYLRLMLQILDRGPLDEEYRQKFRRYVSLVETETNRCTRIISNLLAFSRKSPATHSRVKIDDLLNRCVILSQHKLELSNIGLVLDVDPDMPEISGDFSQLQQGIINLVFNAIDAMPEGGTLNLSASCNHNRQWITITVKDSGQGIAAKDINHIFDPFFTTKKEGYGVGLGLSTVYGIVERHHGTIHAESQPGRGASFIIRLPVIKETLE